MVLCEVYKDINIRNVVIVILGIKIWIAVDRFGKGSSTSLLGTKVINQHLSFVTKFKENKMNKIASDYQKKLVS